MKTINKELFNQQSCNFKFLAKEGFNTPKYYDFDTYDDFENLIVANLNTHETLGINGFIQELEEIDSSNHNVFFSYNDIYKSKLTDISWIPNPSGEIIPTAIFELVVIGEKKYTSCSLRNVAYLEKLITSKKMAIGDEVYIVLKDDNIPSIIGVVKNNNGCSIEVPTSCPVCESSLEIVNHKFVCTNDDCSNKITDILMNYFELLDNKDFNEILLSELVKLGATSISDLKKITKNKISHLDNSENIIDILSQQPAINKQQLIHLTQPKNNSIVVIGHFMNNTDLDVLLNPDTKASDILDVTMVDESSRIELINTIDRQLLVIRENSKFFNIKDGKLGSLNNQIFCLTNTMKHDSMKKYEKMIIDCGGRIGSVSKKLNFLVTNEIENTKYKKVIETNTKLYNSGKTHSIVIIDESDLLKMMEK